MKKIIDHKYIGVPNICFSLIKKDDDREKEYSKQRIEFGFDDSETWSLRDTIANFIIPRLERYEEISKDFLVRDEELISDINKFLIAMKLTTRENGSLILSEEEEKQMDEGLDAFSKIFLTLWW